MAEYNRLKNTFYRDLLSKSDLDATGDLERQYLLSQLPAQFDGSSNGEMMFHYLGTLTATGGSLADRWYNYLTNVKGYSGSLRGMQKRFFEGGSF